MSIALAGCNRTSGTETTAHPHGGSDEMWSEFRNSEVLEVVKKSGRVYTTDTGYELPSLSGYNELEEGKVYKLIADVTLLNGGVAGYVDYPQIERVISIEEISK